MLVSNVKMFETNIIVTKVWCFSGYFRFIHSYSPRTISESKLVRLDRLVPTKEAICS